MKKGEKRGFTIIEVSLVLAIAGLIMMMVFIALPALQRSQRDTQRKDDVTEFVRAVKNYQTNNRGALPNGDGTVWRSALNNYLGGDFEDPDGDDYILTVKACNGSTENNCEGDYSLDELKKAENAYKLYVVTQAKCADDDTKGVVGSSNPRKFAVLYKMEGGGMYCESS